MDEAILHNQKLIVDNQITIEDTFINISNDTMINQRNIIGNQVIIGEVVTNIVFLLQMHIIVLVIIFFFMFSMHKKINNLYNATEIDEEHDKQYIAMAT